MMPSPHERTGRRLSDAAAAVVILLLSCAGTSRADLILSVQSVSANPGSSGNAFEVSLRNSGSSGVVIGGFSFEVSTTSAAVTFTKATTSTQIDPYLFAGHSLFGPDITVSTGSNPSTLDANDNYDTANRGMTLAAGATVGLGEVFFNLAAFAGPAPITVTLGNSSTTNLSAPDGSNIAIDRENSGTIRPNTVPAPPALLLMAIGLAGCLPAFRFRRPRPAA